MEVKVDNLLPKKLDLFLNEIKNEESKTKIETIDRKVQVLEVELEESMAIIHQVIASICSALSDSRTSTVEQQQHFTGEALRFGTLVAVARSVE